MDTVDKMVHDVNNLYNITTSLSTSLSYYQLVFHITPVLTNLWDSLFYIRTVSMHTMDYVDTATTGTLSPMLCNPKNSFVRIIGIFDLSSIYFLYPLTSLPKMVTQEMPASIEQS